MAIEEEFGIEIPDAEADEITTVQQGEFNFISLSWELWCGGGARSQRISIVNMLLTSSCRVYRQGEISGNNRKCES
jgi:hypothetical protein